jgi:hypothetical protein
MRKLAIKTIIISIILLFCNTHLQAQFIVFEVKGGVEMSNNREVWNSLKKRDVLVESDFVRMVDNSLMHIIDSKSYVYSFSNPDTTISVSDIVNQRKKAVDGMTKNSGNRKATQRVRNNLEDGSEFFESEFYENVSIVFKDLMTLEQYDSWDSIPAGTIFFIAINNSTRENILVNVFQGDENDESTPIFPDDIYLNKNTIVEFPEILFGKQENKNNQFIVNYSNINNKH